MSADDESPPFGVYVSGFPEAANASAAGYREAAGSATPPTLTISVQGAVITVDDRLRVRFPTFFSSGTTRVDIDVRDIQVILYSGPLANQEWFGPFRMNHGFPSNVRAVLAGGETVVLVEVGGENVARYVANAIRRKLRGG